MIIKKFHLRSQKLILEKIPVFAPLFPFRYFYWPQAHYNSEFEKLTDKTYLDGYWQSERYFKGIREVLLNEFVLSAGLSESSTGLSEDICSSNSVGLHIRRGDYIERESTNRVHGVCPLDYYRQAVKFISKKIKEPVFYVFSR